MGPVHFANWDLPTVRWLPLSTEGLASFGSFHIPLTWLSRKEKAVVFLWAR